MSSNSKNIVCIGGGTGSAAVLKALKDLGRVSAIASMADDGGSSGRLRETEHVLPPGSVRPALVALAGDEAMANTFEFRFENNHAFGNLMLAALEKTTGSFEQAIQVCGEILKINGDVIPVTFENVRLVAELEDGVIINGETNIDIPKGERAAIKHTWLEPSASANPRALVAISKADMIIIGPGDLYTSIIPNFLVHGVPEAIRQSKAKKIYLCNLMTKHGETDGYAAEDFLKKIEAYVPINTAVFNNKKPNEKLLAKYRKTKSEFVLPPPATSKHILADVLAEDGYVRHDSGKKLANVIFNALRD